MGNLSLLPFLWLFLFMIFSSNFSFTTALDDGDIASTRYAPPPPPATPQQAISESSGSSRVTPFKPGITIIVGVLTTIFSITFLLLLYVKHCKRGTNVSSSRGHLPSRNHSGINRKVIESLPMFRFSSLRGQKDGLECAVCLNKFEADEVLRLLPKCKHAFHVECVDTWLDAHSTCPLCRYRVDPEDMLLVVDFHDSRSLFNNQETPRHSAALSPGIIVNPRISGRHSSAAERGRSMEIIVEDPGEASKGRVSLDSWKSRRKPKINEPEHSMRRSVSEVGKPGQAPVVAENTGRKSLDSWRSFCMKSGHETRKDGQLLVAQNGEKHRLEHRIIISTEETSASDQHQRWSDVQPSELLYLKSEMIMSERREGQEGSGRGVITGRSVSEITGVSRYRSNERERHEVREGVVMRWLAWISQSPQYKHQKPAVQSSSSSSSAVVV
ncbi:RING-H2 finger protein ATL43 [Primulina huaijiensis]|uniref:RING-H2 finger protein ATL43 n=1 Tax=Primulina huaijiensis TaxID=1492673 RepID=UPI003CC7249C